MAGFKFEVSIYRLSNEQESIKYSRLHLTIYNFVNSIDQLDNYFHPYIIMNKHGKVYFHYITLYLFCQMVIELAFLVTNMIFSLADSQKKFCLVIRNENTLYYGVDHPFYTNYYLESLKKLYLFTFSALFVLYVKYYF